MRRIRGEITEVIALQERLGLDVLVRGEPGAATWCSTSPSNWRVSSLQNGWVQSYGSRQRASAIMYGDVSPAAGDDGRVDHLRAVADRQTGEGHVDRSPR